MDRVKRSFSDYSADARWTADVVVIGAGAGGAATACALSEAGLDVIVLEHGGHWNPSDFRADSGWAYREIYAGRGGRATFGNAVIPVPGGRGVGGSTLINSAICFRTPDQVLDEWVDHHGCTRLSREQMAGRLDRVWKTLGVTVNPVIVQKNNNLIFKKGADALGLPGEFMARSAPGCVGCGVCQFGCPTGGKWSVDRTFLTEALATGRCAVHAHCKVEGMETKGGRVVAVTGRTIDPKSWEPAGRFEVRADTVVVSAGPIGSPRILLGNGLADDTICGRNLYLHPTSGMLARFPHEIRPWEGVTQGYYIDYWERGFLLQTYTVSPDQLYVAMPWSLGKDLLSAVRDMSHMGMAGPLVHDEDSVGSVGMAGLSYFVGNGDRGKLLEGMRECSRVFFAAGATEVYPGIVGGRPIRSVAEIDRVIRADVPARKMYLYASHPMGTCRMGDSPERSVVDPNGRVWGWDNLYVADASVFPTSLGVNPQVTTMAVGLTVAESVSNALASGS